MARSVLAKVLVFISFAFAALRLLESTLPCLFRQKTGQQKRHALRHSDCWFLTAVSFSYDLGMSHSPGAR
jgi:hypothetical protein